MAEVLEPPAAPPSELAPASPARRSFAFAIDRVLGWGIGGGEAYVAYTGQIKPGHVLEGLAAILGTFLLVGLFVSLLVGLYGLTPGKALVGLRVVSAGDGGPIGIPRAVLRTSILGLATLPTLGVGAVALGWSALADPTGQRRGWHDLRAGSVVVDLRPVTEAVDETEDPQPAVAEPVNMTAMRLVHEPEPEPEPEDVEPVVAAPAAPLPQRVPAGARRSPAAPAPSAVARRWRVHFDTGEEFEVGGLTLVGRRPEPRPGEPVKRLVTLSSDDMSLSKTHAQFEVAADGALVAMDRGSTNGSFLYRGEVPKRLVADRPATLRDGDRVRFGDREMTVTLVS